MPRVEVLSDVQGRGHKVMLSEHVPSGMFADGHYADQLVERMGWALLDAEEHEQQSAPVADAGQAASARLNP